MIADPSTWGDITRSPIGGYMMAGMRLVHQTSRLRGHVDDAGNLEFSIEVYMNTDRDVDMDYFDQNSGIWRRLVIV